MDPNHTHHSPGPGIDWSRINQWLLWLGLATAVAWMALRHGAHLLEIAPFLILLACPLMHLFGHGAHGGHANHSSTENDRQMAPGHESAKASLRREDAADGHMH